MEPVELPAFHVDTDSDSDSDDQGLVDSARIREDAKQRREKLLNKLGERRLSFTLTPLDMLKLRPFLRMVREKTMIRRQRGNISPFSKKKKMWNSVFYAFLCYQLLTIPFRLSFYARDEAPAAGFLAVDGVCDLFFIIDLIFSMSIFSMYDDTGRLVYRKLEIFKMYIHSNRFFVNFIACFPIDWIVLIFLANRNEMSIDVIWKAIHIIRLVKLIRLFQLPALVAPTDQYVSPHTTSNKSTTLRTSSRTELFKQIAWQERQILLIFIFGVHYLACIWQALQTNRLYRLKTENPESATNFFPHNGTTSEDKILAYFRALYFTSISVTCTGFGDIVAIDEYEVFFSLVAMSFGFIVFIFLIGLMISLLKKELLKDRIQRRRMEMLDMYIRSYKLPIYLGERIFSYYRFLWNRQDGLVEEKFLENLTARHRTLVVQDQVLHLLKCLPFSEMLERTVLDTLDHTDIPSPESNSGLDDTTHFFPSLEHAAENKNKKALSMTELALVSFYRAMCGKMKQETFSPNVAILQKGQAGDRLYFLIRGGIRVHRYNDNDNLTAADDVYDTRKSVIAGYDSFFSASCLKYSAITLDYSDMFYLTRNDFLDTLKYFPFIRTHILQMMVKAEEVVFDESLVANCDQMPGLKLPSLSSYLIEPHGIHRRSLTPIPIVATELSSVIPDHTPLVVPSSSDTGGEQHERTCVVLPDSKRRVYWDVLCLVMALYYLLVTPFRMTFWRQIDPMHLTYLTVDWLIDILFMVDFAMRLFVFAYIKIERNRSILLTSPTSIAKHYIEDSKFIFIIDMISILPIDVFALMYISGSSKYQIDFWIKWVYMFRINHILRLVHIFEYSGRAELALTLSSSTLLNFLKERLQFVKVMFWLMLFAHLSSCLWALIAFLQIDQNNDSIYGGWMKHDHLNINNEEFLSYSRSFFFILTTMTTIGYGGLVPHTAFEQAFIAFYVVVSTIMYLLVLSSLTVIVDDLSMSVRFFERQKEVMGTIVQLPQISRKNREKIRLYLRKQWTLTRGANESDVWGMLAPHLQNEVRSAFILPILKKIHWYQIMSSRSIGMLNSVNDRLKVVGVQTSLCLDLISHATAFLASPGDHILNRGEYFDCIYLLYSGSISVSYEAKVSNRTRKRKKRAGDYFGEDICVSGADFADFFYIADSFSHLFTIKAEDIHRCMSGYPILRTLLIKARYKSRLNARYSGRLVKSKNDSKSNQLKPSQSQRNKENKEALVMEPPVVQRMLTNNGNLKFLSIDSSRFLLTEGCLEEKIVDVGSFQFDKLVEKDIKCLMEGIKLSNILPNTDMCSFASPISNGSRGSTISKSKSSSAEKEEQTSMEFPGKYNISDSFRVIWNFFSLFFIVLFSIIIPLLLTYEAHMSSSFTQHESLAKSGSTLLFIILLFVDVCMDIFFCVDMYLRGWRFITDETLDRAFATAVLKSGSNKGISMDEILSRRRNHGASPSLDLHAFRANSMADLKTAFVGTIRMPNSFVSEDEEQVFLTGEISNAIFKQYFSSFASILDIIASFPFNTMCSIMLLSPSFVSHNVYSIFVALRLCRLLRLHRLFVYFENIENAIEERGERRVNPIVLRFLKHLIVILLLCHWSACIWLEIGYEGDKHGNTGWLFSLNSILNVMPKTFNAFYISSLYFVMVTIATIGYGDIQPTSPSESLGSTFSPICETVFLSFLSIFGVVLYSTVTANLASILSSLGASLSREYFETGLLAQIESFISKLLMNSRDQSNPKSIQAIRLSKKIKGYASHIWTHQKGFEEDEILKRLPPTLRRHVMVDIYLDYLKASAIFGHGEICFSPQSRNDSFMNRLRTQRTEFENDSLSSSPQIPLQSIRSPSLRLRQHRSESWEDDQYRDEAELLPLVFLHAICMSFHSRVVPQGDVIVQKGERADCLLLIREGDAAVLIDRLTERALEEGSLYGMSFLTLPAKMKDDVDVFGSEAIRHPYSLAAKTCCRVASLPLKDLVRICDEYPFARPMLEKRWKLYNSKQKKKKTGLENDDSPPTFSPHVGGIRQKVIHFRHQKSSIFLEGNADQELVIGKEIKTADASNTLARYESMFKNFQLEELDRSYLYLPEAPFRTMWERAAFCLTLIFLPLYPLYFSYALLLNEKVLFYTLFGIFFIFDIFFICNLFLVLRAFIPAELANGEIYLSEITSNDIMKSYFTKKSSHDSKYRPFITFFIDIIGAFPFALVLLIVYVSSSMTEFDFIIYATIFRLNTLFVLLSRFYSYLNQFISWLDEVHFPYQYRRILQVAFFVFILLHWVSSLWLVLGHINENSDNANNWMHCRDQQIVQSPLILQYLFSYYFIFSTITTLGYGDITPQTMSEVIFLLFFILMCASIYSAIIGNISVHMASLRAHGKWRKRQEQLEASNELFLDTYCEMREVSVNLHKKLWQYANEVKKQENTICTSYDSYEDFELLSVLPHYMASHVAHFMLKEAILDVPFFAALANDYSFICSLALSFVPEIYIPSEYIIRVGDIGNEMFLLLSGRVTVLIFENISEGRRPGMRIKKKVSLESPVHVGETSFFSCNVRTSSILCGSLVRALKLTRHAFDVLLDRFPEHRERIHKEFVSSALLIYDDLIPMLETEAAKHNVVTEPVTEIEPILPVTPDDDEKRLDYVAKLIADRKRETAADMNSVLNLEATGNLADLADDDEDQI